MAKSASIIRNDKKNDEEGKEMEDRASHKNPRRIPSPFGQNP